MLNDYFYHGTTRKAISLFGSLFNNIYVRRVDSSGNVINSQRVPLSYGPMKKFLARIDQNRDSPEIAVKLPRISFEISDISYDASNKLNRFIRSDESENHTQSYVPYDISLALSIYTDTQDDGMQIMEQILPYFQPDYTVSVTGMNGLNKVDDVPIILSSVGQTLEYEGSFENRNVFTWAMGFKMKVRYYGPILERKRIMTAITNIHVDSLPDIPEV